MLEIIQWFDNRERFVALIVLIAVIAMAIGNVISAFRDTD